MKLDGLTIPELVALRSKITIDPKSKAVGLFLHQRQVRKKTELIDRQITFLLAEKRKAAGNPVPCDGYSGRNSNKR